MKYLFIIFIVSPLTVHNAEKEEDSNEKLKVQIEALKLSNKIHNAEKEEDSNEKLKVEIEALKSPNKHSAKLLAEIRQMKWTKALGQEMVSNFPLPWDVNSIVVKYHNLQICAKYKGKEKCIHRKPTNKTFLERIIKFAAEAEVFLFKNSVDGGTGTRENPDKEKGEEKEELDHHEEGSSYKTDPGPDQSDDDYPIDDQLILKKNETS